MISDKNRFAHKLMDTFFKFKRPNIMRFDIPGIKPSEIHVLFVISKVLQTEENGVKVIDISNFLKVASPTVTQQINSLEEGGFVERTVDKDDRRAVRIKITPKGEDILKIANKRMHSFFNGLSEYLGEEDSEKLIDLLTKLSNYFNQSNNSI